MSTITWILEPDVYTECHDKLREALKLRGHKIIDWDDLWWTDGIPKSIPTNPIVFHGSLGNASRINQEMSWIPGSFCTVENFKCSNYFEKAQKWLLHKEWKVLPASQLVANPIAFENESELCEKIFVRPDSPLKPFSGRVLEVDKISLRSLDHGFYYEDENLPVVVAPIRNIGSEWRFVICNNKVITGSGYVADTRSPTELSSDDKVWSYAAKVANDIEAPEIVYVLDVCECDGDLHLIELNPFSGADLYACDSTKIVNAVVALI